MPEHWVGAYVCRKMVLKDQEVVTTEVRRERTGSLHQEVEGSQQRVIGLISKLRILKHGL